MNLHWLTVVWGRDFTDYYVNVIIPSQLSARNLPKCFDESDSKYIIYTTPEDAETIRRAPVYGRLMEAVHNQLAIIDDLLDDVSQAQQTTSESCGDSGSAATLCHVHPNKYEAMTRCHRHAILAARDTVDVAFVFLAPDAILSDGSFANMLQIAKSGKRAIMTLGLRVNKDSFGPVFVQSHYCDILKTAEISSRNLARLAIDHLHPSLESFFWSSQDFGEWPSFVLWKASQDEILARSFHLHPLLVRPVDREALPETTIDGNFILRACPNLKDIHVVEDSDEILCVEITSGAKALVALPSNQAPLSADPRKVGLFAFRHCDTHHREFFRRNIIIHAGSNAPDVNRAIIEAHEVETRVFYWYRFYMLISWFFFDFGLAWSRWKRVIWFMRSKAKIHTRLIGVKRRIYRMTFGVNEY